MVACTKKVVPPAFCAEEPSEPLEPWAKTSTRKAAAFDFAEFKDRTFLECSQNSTQRKQSIRYIEVTFHVPMCWVGC